MKRLAVSTMLAWAAYALAIGIGIPHWIEWPTWQVPADACDIAILVFASSMLLLNTQKAQK